QSTFTINVDRTGVTGAVLIAPGATTHGNDMHQRAVNLPVTVRGSTLTVKLPPSAALVPPGYYMLFVLDKTGAPSVAKFVQVS
ncbi:MAG: putative Galactose oxidase precursor, partial [Ramlibacter sp.]|nr:putative Galactose oxidase precursor [Ramlibacter sp.]